MPEDLGPPGPKDAGRSHTQEPAPAAESDNSTTNAPKITTPSRQCPANTVAELHRRRQASYRLPSLDCGCRDPWPCWCSSPPLSEKMIDAGRAAARHILDSTGRVPLLEFEVLQALWRRGGEDRVLAEMLHAAAGGEIR